MIAALPLWVDILFLITTAATILLFYFANGKNKGILSIVLLWAILQSIIAYSGFYLDFKSMPPRFSLVLIPTTLILLIGLLPRFLQPILEKRSIYRSSFLHTIRIPVEICLYELFLVGSIPELMTFEGRNFDILAGLSAPIIGLLWLNGKLGKKGLLLWNIIALGLVSFILINGVLSAELPFQQFAFDQPNRALAYFPYILLPAIIVPIVMYTHITDIILLRRELRGKSNN